MPDETGAETQDSGVTPATEDSQGAGSLPADAPARINPGELLASQLGGSAAATSQDAAAAWTSPVLPDQDTQAAPLRVGRIVHYVLANGEHRPAVVVNVFGDPDNTNGVGNLAVFLDGYNDNGKLANMVLDRGRDGVPGPPMIGWATSSPYGATGAPYTWHWPERV